MTPAAFVQSLAQRGLTLTVSGDKLQLHGPADARTDAVRAAIKEHKQVLLTHLLSQASVAPYDDELIRLAREADAEIEANCIRFGFPLPLQTTVWPHLGNTPELCEIYKVADDSPLPPVYCGRAVYYETERTQFEALPLSDARLYHRNKIALFRHWPAGFGGWVHEKNIEGEKNGVQTLAKRAGVPWEAARDLLWRLQDAGAVRISAQPSGRMSDVSYCLVRPAERAARIGKAKASNISREISNP